MGRFVGGREYTVDDRSTDLSFPMLVFYPTRTASESVTIGPYAVYLAMDAPVEPGRFPLVAISHGSGGSHLAYRTLGAHLALHGYIVAMPEHPGNNRNDNSLEGTAENLTNRPRHVSKSIDTIIADQHFAGHMDRSSVAIVGHSMGGYSALAVAGGRPRTEGGEKVSVAVDDRVRALVLLAPATPWYLAEAALEDVSVPILMMVAEHDRFTPAWHAEIVLKGVPDRSRVTHRVVENAGHYSFLSPFPSAMRSPDFPPSTDPKGFDRVKFHVRLNEEVLEFLNVALSRNIKQGS